MKEEPAMCDLMLFLDRHVRSFSVALRPQRPYGQYIRTGKPRTATSTCTQLLSSELNTLRRIYIRYVFIAELSERCRCCARAGRSGRGTTSREMSFIRRGLTSHHGPGRQLTMATRAATPETKSRCLPSLFVGPHSSQCRPIILPSPRSDHVQNDSSEQTESDKNAVGWKPCSCEICQQ